MVQALTSTLIHSLKQPADQHVLATLHYIKNSLIGHDQRKEDAVRSGLIEPLAAIISQPSLGDGTTTNGDVAAGNTESIEQHETKRQAVLIIASLASGGPSFVSPLLSVDILKQLLVLITTEGDVNLVTDALRAVRDLTVSWASLEITDVESSTSEKILFSTDSQSLFETAVPKIASLQSPRHDRLLCDIIANACEFSSGVFLATKDYVIQYLLSLVAIHQTEATHTGDVTAASHRLPQELVSSIFRALSNVLTHSTHSANNAFQSLSELLAHEQPSSKPTHSTNGKPGEKVSQPSAYKGQPGGRRTFVDLPDNFTHKRFADTFTDREQNTITWSIETARSLPGAARLSVLRLLTTLNAVLADTERNKLTEVSAEQKVRARCGLLARCVVPLSVRLIQDCSEKSIGKSREAKEEERFVREQACSVLASLIRDHRELQVAAVEAGAIKFICPLLRRSFDHIYLPKPIWTPQTMSDQGLPDVCRMGPSGLPSKIVHVMKCRAGALEALAALADRDDEHRKAIVDSGIINCVVDSLKPFPSDAKSWTTTNGNTAAVILAACKAAQNMSRSVSLLRTSLIDAGVARPILDLLTHPDTRVQIAATDVCANLVLDVSPMREQLTASGVIDTLCEHTKSGSPALKFSSLWALKHSVLEASVEQRKKTLQNLGVEWLADTIVGNTQLTNATADKAVSGVTLRSANAAGDKVDLLNPSGMDVDDVGMQSDDNDEELEEGEDEDGELYFDEASQTHYHASSIRSTLHPATKTSSTALPSFDISSIDPTLQAQRDDVALQQQALDFLRNLLNGESCSEMVGHLFEQFGQDRLLTMLTEKLSPTQRLHSSAQQSPNNGSSR